MADRIEFTPNFSVAGTFHATYDRADFAGERSMYACSLEYVRRHGGDIARLAIDSIPEEYLRGAEARGLYPNVDIRVHDLDVGDFPASPGWHCDSALRELHFGQRSGARVPVEQSLIATASTNPHGVSNTQFLTRPCSMHLTPTGDDFTLWRHVDRHIGEPTPDALFTSRDGQLIQFDTQTLHRAMPATRTGIRLFMRVSLWATKDNHQGNLAKFEQVYRRIPSADADIPANADARLCCQPRPFVPCVIATGVNDRQAKSTVVPRTADRGSGALLRRPSTGVPVWRWGLAVD